MMRRPILYQFLRKTPGDAVNCYDIYEKRSVIETCSTRVPYKEIFKHKHIFPIIFIIIREFFLDEIISKIEYRMDHAPHLATQNTVILFKITVIYN